MFPCRKGSNPEMLPNMQNSGVNYHQGFESVTPHMLSSMKKNDGSNLQKSFSKEETKPLIDRQDYRNPNTTLHNNLGQNLLSEHITEYHLAINTSDRDVKQYPSPFNITVDFNGVGSSIQNEYVNGTYRETRYPGTPAPTISRSFKNIKYITLDSVILPRTVGIDSSDPPNFKPISHGNFPNFELLHNKLLLLKVKQLTSVNFFGTGNLIYNDTFALKPDNFMSLNGHYWKAVQPTFVFPTSQLYSLNQMTLQLLDENGQQLHFVDHLGNDFNFNKVVHAKDWNGNLDNFNIQCIKELDRMMQVIYFFTLGIFENEMNTDISYYK